MTFICESSPRRHDARAKKPIDEANDRRGKIKRFRIQGLCPTASPDLTRVLSGSSMVPPPSHAGITHLDQTPDLSELRV